MAFVSPEQIKRRRLLADRLSQQATSPFAVRRGGLSAASGIANVLRQFGAGRANFLAGQDETENARQRQQILSQALGGGKLDFGALAASGDPGLQLSALTGLSKERQLQMSLDAKKALFRAEQGKSTPQIRNFQFSQGLPDDTAREAFVRVNRNQPLINLGGQFVQPSALTPGKVSASFPVGLKPQDVPETAAAKASAVAQAKADVAQQARLEKGRTKRQLRLQSTEEQTNLIDDTVKRAKKLSGAFTTGFIGSTLSKIPGTPAFDLSQLVLTLQANAGFGKLQEMRDFSPTGGALGQVAVKELELLQASASNLKQSQSREQFEENLDIFNAQVKRSRQRARDAYKKDFGVTAPKDMFTNKSTFAPPSATPSVAQPVTDQVPQVINWEDLQ